MIKKSLTIFLLAIVAFAVSCANTDPTTGGGGGIVIEKPVIPATDAFYADVQAYLAGGGSPNDMYNEQYSVSWFFQAVYGNYLASANLLIEKGANVNFKCAYYDEKPVLGAASYYGYTDMVQLLLSAGANVNLYNSYGTGALLDASYNNHVDTVELLLRAGADVNKVNNSGWTPLLRASCDGYTEVARLLIDGGANVDFYRKEYVDRWTAG